MKKSVLKCVVLSLIILFAVFLSACGDNVPNDASISNPDLKTQEEISPESESLELQTIKAEAEKNLEEKENAVKKLALREQENKTTYSKCKASDDTIAEVAYNVMVKEYPMNVVTVYTPNVIRDEYGRVICYFSYEWLRYNMVYETDTAIICLQSCSSTGSTYTYEKSGVNPYCSNAFNTFMNMTKSLNDFYQKPEEDTNETEYKNAIQLVKSGNYSSAVSKLRKLNDYKACKEITSAIDEYTLAKKYYDGINYYEKCEFDAALEEFRGMRINDYYALSKLIELCTQKQAEKDYINAESLYESEAYSNALSIFSKLGDYKDSSEMVGNCLQQIYDQTVIYKR